MQGPASWDQIAFICGIIAAIITMCFGITSTLWLMYERLRTHISSNSAALHTKIDNKIDEVKKENTEQANAIYKKIDQSKQSHDVKLGELSRDQHRLELKLLEQCVSKDELEQHRSTVDNRIDNIMRLQANGGARHRN